jgi:hypothetical protein
MALLIYVVVSLGRIIREGKDESTPSSVGKVKCALPMLKPCLIRLPAVAPNPAVNERKLAGRRHFVHKLTAQLPPPNKHIALHVAIMRDAPRLNSKQKEVRGGKGVQKMKLQFL